MNEQRPSQKTITLAEVALRAGVSKMTASKVMRNTGSISQATQDRVREAASVLGYVPNRLAGALSSKTRDIVAVVLPSINDKIFGDVVSGINEILRPAGYITFIGETHFDGKMEEDILSTVLSLHPAGIILTGGICRSENALSMLKRWSCPTIQIWDDSDSDFDGSVAPAHAEAGRLIAQLFHDRGFKNPAYIGAELQKDLCAARRFDAFHQMLSEFGRAPNAITPPDLPRQWDTGRALAAELMKAYPETDAIYCLNDAMGLGALAWLHENGYDIPSRVAVAGFNGTSSLNAVRTRLTTVHVERHELGLIAARAILDLLNGHSIEKVSLLEPELIVGNTT
ncbi:MAG: LacI family DNA-binding transcriptional regulator [Pseudomonadota bacterium]